LMYISKVVLTYCRTVLWKYGKTDVLQRFNSSENQQRNNEMYL
jgi:hypothetical protein